MMDRRRLIFAAPLAGAFVGLPVVAVCTAPKPSLDYPALYAEWQRANLDYIGDDDDPADCAIFDRVCAIEDLVTASVPRSVEDYALKIVFADHCGTLNATRHQSALAAEAQKLCGLRVSA